MQKTTTRSKHTPVLILVLLILTFQVFWLWQGGLDYSGYALGLFDAYASDNTNTTTTTTPTANTGHSQDCDNDDENDLRYPPENPTALTSSDVGRASYESGCSSSSFSHVVVQNVVANQTVSITKSGIPNMVHQTMKSRCVQAALAKNLDKWKFPGFSYHFWDDQAVMSLFRARYDEFPALRPLTENCLVKGTVKADLWRYLAIYTYGGIYADTDSAPKTFDPHTHLTAQDVDAYFVMEMYGLPSQYFFASAPRHPFLYYTIQQILASLFLQADTGRIQAPRTTGPHALARGITRFLQEGQHAAKYQAIIQSNPAKSMPQNPMFPQGTYVGMGNWTLRIEGMPGRESDRIIRREAITRPQKLQYYHSMNMTHFLEDRSKASNISCMDALWKLRRRQ